MVYTVVPALQSFTGSNRRPIASVSRRVEPVLRYGESGRVLDRFAARFAVCVTLLAELPLGIASLDIEQETNRQLELWARIHEPPNAPGEIAVKVGLRAELLERLLGERLITRCIHVDRQGLTMAQVQQIVECPLSDVPIDRLQTDGAEPSRELQVVDRDAFALELAREWVKTGLPRNPIR